MAKGSPALAMEVVKGLYRQPSSFTDLLPWVEYDPDSGCFLLEDGISVGALFELEAVGTEARTDKFMTELRDAIQTALNDAIPEEESAPAGKYRIPVSVKQVVMHRCHPENRFRVLIAVKLIL